MFSVGGLHVDTGALNEEDCNDCDVDLDGTRCFLLVGYPFLFTELPARSTGVITNV